MSLSVDFSTVDWRFLQQVYGWSITQHQSWARGSLICHGEGTHTVKLFADNVLEFLLDGESYFGGDVYGMHKAPLLLHLEAGEHTLEIRLLRDVRTMGGLGNPSIELFLKAEVCENTLSVDPSGMIMPEVVDGRLPTFQASIPVCNTSPEWIKVSHIELMMDSRNMPEQCVNSITFPHLSIAPG